MVDHRNVDLNLKRKGSMGICWYCHWGWPKQFVDIYQKYETLIGNNAFTALNYGPAHVVWDDENFDRGIIQSCIDDAEKWYKEWNVSPNFGGNPKLTKEELKLVVESLKELLLLPDDILYTIPQDYDDENPEQYPPPEGMVMMTQR